MKEAKLQNDKITEVGWEVSRVCNLSSLPRWALSYVTNRIVTSKNNITIMPVQGRAFLETATNDIASKIKAKVNVTYIVDDDDKNAINKIKNIGYINNWSNSGIIRLMVETSVKPNDLTTGKVGLRIANHHHNNKMLQAINAKTVGQKEMNGVISAVIVKTFDDRAGSVGGITHALRLLNVPYIMEECVVKYDESWMATKKVLLKYKLESSGRVHDILPDGNVHWFHQTGYGDMMMTEGGIKKIKLTLKTGANDNKNNGKHSKLVKILMWMKRKMIEIMTGINEIIFGKKKGQTNADTKAKKDKKIGERKQKQRKTDKKQRQTRNSAVYSAGINVAAGLAMIHHRSIKSNASSDIKKANRFLADAQLAKMQVRTGILGNKLWANQNRSNALNAYIVGTTSYNVNEATINANQLHAKDKLSNADFLLLVFTFISVAFLIIMNSGILAIIAGSIGMVAYSIKNINRMSAIYLITSIASAHLPLILLALLIVTFEEISLNSDTEFLRSVLYILLTCLIAI